MRPTRPISDSQTRRPAAAYSRLPPATSSRGGPSGGKRYSRVNRPKIRNCGSIFQAIIKEKVTVIYNCHLIEPNLQENDNYSTKAFEEGKDFCVCLAGSRKLNVLPLPSSLSAQIRPLCNSIIACATASPKPMPP